MIPMNRTVVDSSMLIAVSYDSTSEEMDLEFHSGAIYRFFDVPHAIAQALLDAPSKGKFFNAWIRDLFAFEHVRDHGGRRTFSQPSELPA